MKHLTHRKLAAGAIAAAGAIHLLLTPEYMSEQAYLGVLFLAGAATTAYVAATLWRKDHRPAWLAGLGVALGMGVGFVLSRTIGLPGFHESEWEASGIFSLLLEGAFVVAALAALRSRAAGTGGQAPRPA